MSVPSPAIMSYPNYMTTSPAAAAVSGAGAGAPITMLNVNSLLNQKDSRWLQLEVCREFQRQKCSRPDGECKFAHPPPNVEVQNGRVTGCYDSIKVRSFNLVSLFCFYLMNFRSSFHHISYMVILFVNVGYYIKLKQ